MRPIYFLITALAMMLLSGTSFAEDRYECILKCSAEKDTRNVDCPSPYESSTSNEERARCMKRSQDIYIDCFNHCPPPQYAPPPAEESPSSPYPSGY